MLTDDFTREVNDFLYSQADEMLRKQAEINRAVYTPKSGTLTRSLSSSPIVGKDGDISVTVEYPVHIRFLDMKKDVKGKRKRHYAPIYNKYVYGYLKSALWKKIARVVPTYMIRLIDENISGI